MVKIVINICWGGFGLSDKAMEFLGPTYANKGDWDIRRDDPNLVACVEKLGVAANGNHASLRIVEIPDDVDWGIHNYDGSEHVEEKHRTWS